MNNTIFIFGDRATALEIYEVVISYYKEFKNVFFVVADTSSDLSENQIRDSEIEQYLKKSTVSSYYIISMTNQKVREQSYKRAKSFGLIPFTIINPNSFISKSSCIGKGVYIAANVSISNRTKINDHTIINFNSIIGHDSVIGSHSIINPGASIGGNCLIGERILIGSNSFIFQGKKIGNDSLIDALTYVDHDIDSGMICSSKRLRTFKRIDLT